MPRKKKSPHKAQSHGGKKRKKMSKATRDKLRRKTKANWKKGVYGKRKKKHGAKKTGKKAKKRGAKKGAKKAKKSAKKKKGSRKRRQHWSSMFNIFAKQPLGKKGHKPKYSPHQESYIETLRRRKQAQDAFKGDIYSQM